MTASIAEIAQIGVDPIPGDNPAGESARYEPEFEAVSAEIGKLELPVAVEPDYAQVLTLSETILKEKNKIELNTLRQGFRIVLKQVTKTEWVMARQKNKQWMANHEGQHVDLNAID